MENDRWAHEQGRGRLLAVLRRATLTPPLCFVLSTALSEASFSRQGSVTLKLPSQQCTTEELWLLLLPPCHAMPCHATPAAQCQPACMIRGTLKINGINAKGQKEPPWPPSKNCAAHPAGTEIPIRENKEAPAAEVMAHLMDAVGTHLSAFWKCF